MSETTLENDALEVIITTGRRKFSRYDYDLNPRKTNIIYRSRDNNLPSQDLDDFIHWLTDYESEWEQLPGEYEGLSIIRDELVGDIDNNHPEHNLESMLHVQGHTSPNTRVQSQEDLQSAVHKGQLLPTRGHDSADIRSDDLHSKEIAEYGLLENFCDWRLGPPFRHDPATLWQYDAKQAFYEANTEEDITRLLENLPNSVQDDWQDNFWQGLDLLYPDTEERIERIHTFEQNWFPNETKRARQTYQRTRNYLHSLL